ncbi:MAG: DUF3828 domain-containing protein [Sphingorhabdus sp.]
MARRQGLTAVAALALLALTSPLVAAKPVTADEVAVRDIVTKIYAGYLRPFEELFPELPDDAPPAPNHPIGSAIDGYEAPFSASLNALLQKWMPVATGDEVLQMNGFDWYCQCQDFDPKQAKVTAQEYNAKSKDQIEVKIRFTPGGREAAAITYYFVRENGQWVMDNIRFEDGSTLRQGLQEDIDGATLTNAT